MSRPDCSEFLQIFLNDLPMIDTRSPIEFEKGAFPTSVSLPLMTTEERAQVGTCYKQRGQQAAIELGHRLVSGAVKEARVQAWVEFARQHPEGYLYCWRGGLRSGICRQWMHEAGCDYPRITGGYKAMRRFLIGEFERICAQRPMLLLGGRTGCNKTEMIEQLPNAVDLEGLANHRGSSFGRRPGGQPTQLGFENALAVAMLKVEHGDAVRTGAAMVLEDEGRLIGRCSTPLSLQRKMADSPLVVLEVPLEERVEHSYRNYILHKLEEWQQKLDEEAGFDAFADDLTQSLYRVRKRLGGTRYKEVAAMMAAALESQRGGDPEPHRAWIRAMLVDYYDPMYDYQLDKRRERIIFRGERDAVREYLTSTRPQALVN